MPILESIQISEQKAEKMREDARKEVEAMLEKVNEENQQLEKNMLEEAREKIHKIGEQTKKDIAKMKSDIEASQIKNDELDFEKAKSKMPQAIDSIINKVVSS